ncbi:MAG: hypothetical protein KHZ15_00360 [Coprobacillus cateniformis]|uniref:hypothetical protein n=1 Tax=Longibaculum muris TaxID=1796628 RepID=UPI003AB58D84|nr:hypothetical protein [Coprobacillus cateniformis]
MKKKLLKILGWILFEWMMFYVYYLVIAKIKMFVYQTESISEPFVFALAMILDLTTLIVIYGEKIITAIHMQKEDS